MNLASTSCGMRPSDLGNTMRQGEEVRREPQTTIPTPSFTRNHDIWNPMHRTGGAFSQNCMIAIAELHFGKFPDPVRKRIYSWTQHVVDQWSGDGRSFRRSCDVAVNWSAKRFRWFWNAWCEDFVCVEKNHLWCLEGSEKLQTVFATYNQELNRGQVAPTYQKLRKMVRQHIDQTTRTRNFKARNGRNENWGSGQK